MIWFFAGVNIDRSAEGVGYFDGGLVDGECAGDAKWHSVPAFGSA